MLNNIKIGPKLLGAFGMVALIAAIIGIVGYTSLVSLNNQLDEVGQVRLPSVQSLLEMEAAINAVVLAERGATIRRIFNDEAMRKAQFDFMDQNWKKINDALKVYEPLPQTKEEALMWRDFVPLFNNWKKLHEEVRSMFVDKERRMLANVSQEVIDDLDARTFEKVMQARVIWLQVDKLLVDLVALNQTVAEQEVKEANELAERSENIIVIVIFVGVIVAFLLGLFISRSISNPLNQGLVMIQEMGKGHLGMRLNMDRQDEIGLLAKAMDQFAHDLQTFVIGSMQKISRGNLDAKVPSKDNQDEISPAINNTVDAISGLVDEARMLTKAAVEGRLSTRGDGSRFQGGYKEIVEGVNATLDAVLVPINEAAEVLERVAARDLSARVMGNYQGDHARIKQSLNQAVENLDTGLQQVALATSQVATASEQIGSGSQTLSQGASEQASSIEEISSSLEEMSSMTKQNAENSRQANELAAGAKNSAEKGNNAVQKMTVAINDIKKSSDETSKIVKTIDEIAFQTNLLALNAAVEAARAGEAGKGFAVVAEEVRALAQRSAEAARSTSDLIEAAVKSSDGGVKITEEVASILGEIVEGATKVSSLVGEITAASVEQTSGIEQVNTGVDQLNTVTQQNASNAEESASAAEEMSAQAQTLESMVRSFKLSLQMQENRVKKTALSFGHENAGASEHKKFEKKSTASAPSLKRAKSEKVIPLNEDELKNI
jgi:methyl-accepting chemotaxis protein